MIDLTRITDFDWDEEKSRKNQKPGISMAESEQVLLIDHCWYWQRKTQSSGAAFSRARAN